MGIKGIRRYGYDPLGQCIVDYTFFCNILNNNFVVDIFSGNIRESKVQCSFIRKDIFFSDIINMLSDIPDKVFPITLLF